MLLELFLFLFSIYTATAVDLNWPNGEIDQLYSKLLNLPIEHNAKGYINDENLTKKELLKLELAFFYNASEKIFVSMKDAKLTNVQEKLIEEKRGQFDDLVESVKMEERTSEGNKCKLWKFWRNLQEFLAEQQLMDREMAGITNNKEKAEPNLIDCEQIEDILAKNESENAEEKDAEMVGIQIYLQDTKMLTNYQALMHLLAVAQRNESVEENIEWVWYREFVDVFSTKKLDFESNVGYQLRKMRIQNDAKGIVEFKSKAERLMGSNLLAELEVRQPFLMALDLTTKAKLAADYLLLLSKDTTNANIAEFSISIRIYFGRILTVFNKVYLLKQKYVNENNEKMENMLSQIEEKWNKNNLKIFGDLWKVDYQTYEGSLLAIFEFWQKLALLFNKMPILETNEKILLNENPENWHEFLPTFQRVRIELIDDHVQNVIRLYEDWLKKYLKNSLFEGKGALFRLKQFLFPTLFPKSMNKLMEEYSEMKEILRIKLEDGDIAKLQTVNYIIFFDVNSDVKMWKKAQFLLDILANYQWYKWHLKSLSEPQQNIMEQNLAKMEICMDSINEFPNLDKMEETRVEFLKKIYELRNPNEKTFVSGFEVLSKNAEMDSLYSTFSMHEKSLSALLGNDEFKQKLEEIYIDAERFDGQLHNNSTIFSNLFKHCRGVLNTKVDKKWYKLLKKYEALLQTADPLTDSEKQMFNVDTLILKLRFLLKELLAFGRNSKSKNNKKFSRIVIQAAVDVANLELLVENDNLNEKLEQKLRQKCYFESVLGWLEKNGTLLKNAEWRKYVLHRGFISKDQIPEPSESDLRWSKPDCENNLDHEKSMQEWTESECEAHHATFINDLNNRFPNFYKNLAANILSFPKFRDFATLGEEEEIELYKVILGSDDAKMAREAESRLAIKILIQKANESEKLINSKFVDEMQNAKAQAYAIVLISDTFCPSKEWPIDRALCPIIFYATYLNDKVKNQHKTNWFMPDACFTSDANAIFTCQQQFLANDRLEFFKKYLKTNGKNDELIKLLREKSGTFLKLQNLIDQKELLTEFWDKEEIREKLLNKNFFLDKMRLLNNYRRAMAKSSSDTERLSGRLAADVFVWMNHLTEQFSQRKPPPSPSSVSVPSASVPSASVPSASVPSDSVPSASVPSASVPSASVLSASVPSASVPSASSPTSTASPFSKLVNYVWLSFRIIYDICEPTIYMNPNFDFNYKRLSIFLNNFLYEFNNFIQNERKKRFTDVLKNWKANEHSVFCISDMGWLNEDDKKTAAPLEITQQIHFEVLQKYMDDKEIGKDFREIFLDFPYFIQIGEFVLPVSASKTVGKNNENHEEKYRRKNLLQFLKMENIKKLFELHEITYNESDFMGNESEEEAENVKKMKVQNEEEKELNEKGKRNKKRKIQKRKQKMDKKEEDTTKNLMENQIGNKNALQKTFEETPSESDKNIQNSIGNVNKLDDVLSGNAEGSQQIMGKNIQNFEENLSANSKERPFNIVLPQKNAVNFVEKYKNLIVFNCVAEEKNSYDKFCNFVEDQIRSEFTALMEKIDIKNSKEIAVLNTENYAETCKIAKELVQEKFSINFCKLWLVGIESPPMHNNEKLNEYLKDFDSAIKSNYLLKFNHSLAEENDKISEFQKLRADVHSTVQKKWFLMQIMEN